MANVNVSKQEEEPALSKEEEEAEKAQQEFDSAIRLASLVVKYEELLKCANEHVRRLQLPRALPHTMGLTKLLNKLSGLRELDLSNNNLGPQPFRILMLGLATNETITSLNVANNNTDTDSAACIGEMLSSNRCLECLDVSGNYLGKDYFSRCVGQALVKNSTLQILRFESIGSVDLDAVGGALKSNTSLVELSASHNDLTDPGEFCQYLADSLKVSGCSLRQVKLKNCGLQGPNLVTLKGGIQENEGLCKLDISKNTVGSLNNLMDFIVTCVHHTTITTLEADDMNITETGEFQPAPVPSTTSLLEVLTLANCGLTDQMVTALADTLGPGAVSKLVDINLTNNPLTCAALKAVVKLTSSSGGSSNLEKLSWGLNSLTSIPEYLVSGVMPELQYLNLRKAKANPAEIAALAPLVDEGGISTLILDGIKISGSDALGKLLAKSSTCSLFALSLSGCSLNDKDLNHLSAALKAGLQLGMLKLSTNRIKDGGVQSIVQALLSHPTHPIKLMDWSSNQIGEKGANSLSELLTSSSHKSQIHSLNLARNAIVPAGLVSLVALIGHSSMNSLHISHQSVKYEEEDMEDICGTLTKAIGMTIERDGEDFVKEATSNCPILPPHITVNLSGLGGNPGPIGSKLDCLAFPTDQRQIRLPHLNLSHALELAAWFKGQDSGECLLTQKEWNLIIGAEKNEAPSWLQLADSRCLALFVSHLPASISPPKMEGILDNEADATADEIYLLKDPVSRTNTGYAWILLSDAQSVQRAIDFYNRGEARVFGQAFMISKVNVKVDDEASAEHGSKAREEMVRRAAVLRAEQKAHRQLIAQSYAESQARHAYRLAHPAYADGRIW